MESTNMNDLYGLYTMSASLMTLGIGVGTIILVVVFFLLLIAVCCVVFGIPYYRMAKNAGLAHPWLAFVPYGNYYIMLKLPQREFNIFNWIRTYDRDKVFKYYLITCICVSAISVLFFIPYLNILFAAILQVPLYLYTIVAYIFMWRVNYDILMTYGMEEHAMWASIVNCFCPIIMVVFSFMIMDRKPDYTV